LPAKEPPGKDWLKFSVDSHLVGELGERLVAQNYVALAELIKNSYDADATKVTIRLVNTGLGEGLGSIEVVDNGHGMDFGSVRDHWMRVATVNKIEQPTSPRFGRPKTGNKGIGRFACQRLAQELEMETTARTAQDHFEHTILRIVWADFVPGTDLTEIPCEVHHGPATGEGTGLTLRLQLLREAWTQRDFDILRRQILTLTISKGQTREGFEADPGFEIVIEGREWETDPRPLYDQLMDAGWGRLKVQVDSKGEVAYTLDAKGVQKVRFEPPEPRPSLKGVTVDLAVVPRKKKYYRRPDIISQGVSDIISDEYAGVRVYLDGFRVYPYGEFGDDWLDLDKESARNVTAVPDRYKELAGRLPGVNVGRAWLNHPRNAWLFGGVQVSTSETPELTPKSNREGFVQTPAFISLKELCRDALDWVTLYYSLFLFRQKEEDVDEKSSELRRSAGAPIGFEQQHDHLLSALAVVNHSVQLLSDQSTPAEIKATKQTLEKGVQVVDAYVGQSRQELNSLRVAASAGAMMLAFSHEIRGVLSSLGSIAIRLDRVVDAIPLDQRQPVVDLAESIRQAESRLQSQLSFWGLLTTQAGKRERQRLGIAEVLKEVRGGFDYMIAKNPVDVDVSSILEDSRTPPMLGGEFYSIVVNLLSNSLKAVWAKPSEGQIKVRVSREKGSFIFDVLDDGVPVPSTFFTDPPEIYVADPEGLIYPALRRRLGISELAAVGTGTGLGLSIVQAVVHSYGGTFRFLPSTPPWTKVARVKLPD
jgi:signal transduction histidine kinase